MIPFPADHKAIAQYWKWGAAAEPGAENHPPTSVIVAYHVSH